MMDKNGNGNVTDAQIADQIRVVNQTFGGQKAVGTAARKEVEALLGRRVHLDLRVRVRKGWRRDDALLDRLGID